MNTFFEDVMGILRNAVSKYGSIRKLAEAAKMNPSTVSKWLAETPSKSQRSPNIREVGQVLDLLGVRLISNEKTNNGDNHQIKKMAEEIKRLEKENQNIMLELEKERAISTRLQEIIQSMVSSDNKYSKNVQNPSQEDKIKTD